MNKLKRKLGKKCTEIKKQSNKAVPWLQDQYQEYETNLKGLHLQLATPSHSVLWHWRTQKRDAPIHCFCGLGFTVWFFFSPLFSHFTPRLVILCRYFSSLFRFFSSSPFIFLIFLFPLPVSFLKFYHNSIFLFLFLASFFYFMQWLPLV